jgi:hypothetical protein
MRTLRTTPAGSGGWIANESDGTANTAATAETDRNFDRNRVDTFVSLSEREGSSIKKAFGRAQPGMSADNRADMPGGRKEQPCPAPPGLVTRLPGVCFPYL